MKRWAILLCLAAAYAAVLVPFSGHMKNRPFVEKMGYTPEPAALKLLSADQYPFVAASLLIKVFNYFGGIGEGPANKIFLPPEYRQMNSAIRAAVRLDPYNMDAYYFAQAVMTWEEKDIAGANQLLVYGMQYRSWDFYLPFFAGFNYAYFLKDYEHAAAYYKRVAELTGTDISNLAARYMYEAGKTQMAIDYLSVMVQTARNGAVRTSLQTRLQSFVEARKIEKAADQYTARFRRRPRSVKELHEKDFLSETPQDPYGGAFYIDEKGRVRTTSRFAFGVAPQ